MHKEIRKFLCVAYLAAVQVDGLVGKCGATFVTVHLMSTSCQIINKAIDNQYILS